MKLETPSPLARSIAAVRRWLRGTWLGRAPLFKKLLTPKAQQLAPRLKKTTYYPYTELLETRFIPNDPFGILQAAVGAGLVADLVGHFPTPASVLFHGWGGGRTGTVPPPDYPEVRPLATWRLDDASTFFAPYAIADLPRGDPPTPLASPDVLDAALMSAVSPAPVTADAGPLVTANDLFSNPINQNFLNSIAQTLRSPPDDHHGDLGVGPIPLHTADGGGGGSGGSGGGGGGAPADPPGLNKPSTTTPGQAALNAALSQGAGTAAPVTPSGPGTAAPLNLTPSTDTLTASGATPTPDARPAGQGGTPAATPTPGNTPPPAPSLPFGSTAAFELNLGQSDPRVQFLARGTGYAVFLTARGPVLELKQPVAAGLHQTPADAAPGVDVLQLSFPGAAAVTPVGQGPLAGTSNYFLDGSAAPITNVPQYQQVVYPNVYPGIDLVYTLTGQGQLEFNLVVAPGADPSKAVLTVAGAALGDADGQGNVVLGTASGQVTLRAPTVYQDGPAGRRLVQAGYARRADGSLGFSVQGSYDATRPLTIDPVLDYSTYLGGSNNDFGNAIAVDSQGNAYVTGQTLSPNFPLANPLPPGGLPAAAFSNSQYTAAEGSGTATITVDLNASSAQTLTVRYATHDGSATASHDYNSASGTLTFAPGATAASFTVTLLDDGALDGNEFLTLSLSTPSAGLLLAAPSAATLTLIDNHAALQVSTGAATITTVEGTTAAVAVNLSAPSSQTVSVAYQTGGGSAVAGTDYTAQSGTLTFAPNVVSQTVTVPILDDNTLGESGETFNLSLSSPSVGLSLGSPATTTFVIAETDTAPTVAFGEGGITIFENAGVATMTVNLSAPSGQTVTVRYTTNANTALAGTDYTTSAGTLTFAPGSVTQKLSVPILDDGSADGNTTEQFYVSLSSPSGATLGTVTAEPVTLVDFDSFLLAGFAPTGFSVAEGTSPFTATVALNADHAGTVTLNYSSFDNSAHASTDYTAVSGMLTFAPHELTKSFAVPILDDLGPDFTKNFGLGLSNPSSGLNIYSSSISVTILDSDPTPVVSFQVPAANVLEGAGSVPVTVTLSAPAGKTVTVHYGVNGGSALSGTDYNLTAGTLTFAPGATAASFTVTILDDGSADSFNEILGLGLFNVQGGATLSLQNLTTLTLLEGAPALTAAFGAASSTVNEGVGSATVTVALSAASAQTVTVDYSTSAGSAVAGTDYTNVSGTLTFNPGVVAQSFAVPILDDNNLSETGAATVNLSLSSPGSGLSLGSPATATLSILDNEPALLGTADIFVSKFNSSGGLVYSTFVGAGSGSDSSSGQGIAVDGSGDAFVTGYSQANNFPTTNGALQTVPPGTPNGLNKVVVFKLGAGGNQLQYSTYLTGSNGTGDAGVGVAVDEAGNAYVVGSVTSTNFPATSGGGSLSGSSDAFVAALNPTGTALNFARYLGGSSGDAATGVTLAPDGSLYVSGWSSSSNFPTTSGVLQTSNAGGAEDAFVSQVNTSGSVLAATLLGGLGGDEANGVAVDQAGNVYLTGWTTSANFPTKDPVQTAYASNQDAFVTELNPALSRLAFSTFLGGAGSDSGNGIVVDSADRIGVTGDTTSTDLPTQSPFQLHNAGGEDVFVTELQPGGLGYLYSSYLGGSSADQANGIASDGQALYLTGFTGSSSFPTFNATQGTLAGGDDAFVVKVDPSLLATGDNVRLSEGVAQTVTVATFTASSASSPTYTATVDYGDGGTPGSGTVTADPAGGYDVQINHDYAESGSFSLLVTISDGQGHNTYTRATVTVEDAELTPTGTTITGTAGTLLNGVVVATFIDANPGATQADFTAQVDWGDDHTSSGTISTAAGNVFVVTASNTYAEADVYDVAVIIKDDDGAGATALSKAIISGPAFTLEPWVPAEDPDPQSSNAFLLPVGEFQAALNTGGLRLSQALDFDLSPGVSVGGSPALVYNADTVDVRPIIDATLTTDPARGVPTQIVVTLTWDGTAQSPVTFATTGHSAGDTYLLGAQVASPVTVSGLHTWSLSVEVDFSSGPTVTVSGSGQTGVAANDQGNPLGSGWWLDGPELLIVDSTTGDVVWISGQGDARIFGGSGSGAQTYTSPAGDFGTLVQNVGGTFTYTALDQSTRNFDSSGRLTSVVDSDGIALTYTYDGSGRVAGVSSPDGGLTTLSYDSVNHRVSIEEPGGRLVTLTLDATTNQLTEVDDENGAARTFAYDSAAHLTHDSWDPLSATVGYDATTGKLSDIDLGLGSVYDFTPEAVQGLVNSPAQDAADDVAVETDPRGFLTTFALDHQGRLTEQDTPDGGVQTWQRDDNGLVLVATDARGFPTVNQYDGSGDLTTVTFADGGVASYSYDSSFHKVTVATDPMGRQTFNSYDATTGDLLTTTDPDGGVTTQTWSDGLLQTVTDPNGNTITYLYDSNRRLEVAIDPLGNRTTLGYDTRGNQLTEQDARGDITTTISDARNRLVAEIDPLGDQTTMAYDPAGDLTGQTNPLGVSDDYTYDQRGWLTSETRAADTPAAATTTTLYDATGDVTGTVDPRGFLTEAAFDPVGRPISATDPNTDTSTALYDLNGNVTMTVDALGNPTYFRYDTMNRQVGTTDALGYLTTTVFDKDGEEVIFYDARGEETDTAYDVNGRTVAVTDPNRHTTQTLYDRDGNVTGVIDPRNALTQDVYDADGQEIATVDPLGNRTTMLYDGVGNVTGVIDALGNLTTHLFDAAGREIAVVDPLGDRTTTLYDAADNATGTLDARSNLWQTVFDAADREVAQVDPLGDRATMLYDPTGNVTGTVDALGNLTTHVFDAAGREVAQVDPLGDRTTTLYDAADNATGILDARDNLWQTVFDAAGREVAQVDPLGHRATMLYDPTGNVTGTVDALGNLTTHVFDAAGREVATVDPLGDRTTTLYDANDNATGTLDARGNLWQNVFDADDREIITLDPLTNRTITFYDGVGNVTGVIDALGNLTTHLFDAAGREIAVVDPLGDRTTTLYDAADNATGTLDARSNLWQTVFDAADREVAQVDPLGDRTTTLYDADDNATGTLDARGNLWQTVFDAADREVAQVDPLGDRTTTLYDAADNATGTLDARGNLWQTVFDVDGRVVNTIDPLNNQTTTLYDADGQVTATIDANGRLWDTAYDKAGRIIAKELPKSYFDTSFYHDADGNVTGTLDPLSNLTTYVFDAADRQIGVVDPLGNRTTTLYDGDDNVSGTIDPLGALTTHLYDAAGRETVVVDPLGDRTTTLYDATDNVTGTIDGRSKLWQSVFDAADREVAQVDPLGDRTTTLYDGDSNVTGTVDALGNLTSYVFDAADRQIAEVDPLGHRTTTLLDATGNVTGTLDALDNLTTHLYDAAGRETVVVDPLGDRTTALYDGVGHVTGTIDARGYLWKTPVDAVGRPDNKIDPLGNLGTIIYDADGNAIATIDPRGKLWQTVPDKDNRVIAEVDPLGDRTTTLYNADGEVSGTLDALNELTTILYDAAGRRTGEIEPSGDRSTTLYDGADNVTGTIDGGGLTTILLDDAGRSLAEVDPDGSRTTTLLDADGNVTAVIDPDGNRTSFAYDANRHRIGETDPTGARASYGYDTDGRLAWSIDRLGRRRNLRYDANGRLLGETWTAADGSTIDDILTYAYDAVGNQTLAADFNGADTFSYDAVNRLASEQEPFGLALTFGYDAAGNCTLTQDSFGGITTSIYDDADRLKSRQFGGPGQTPVRMDFTYLADGEPGTVKRYADLAGTQLVGQTSYSYDEGQLEGILHQDGSGNDQLELEYLYWPNGEVKKETDTTSSGSTVTSFLYDLAGQLTATLDASGLLAYAYDKAGNVISGSFGLGADNRLTTDGTWTYTYDAEGNVSQKSQGSGALTWTYGYDEENRLIWAKEWSSPGGTLLLQENFSYDVLGNRLQQSVWMSLTGWVTTRFGYDGDAVWADLDGSNNLVTRYVRPDGEDTQGARIQGTSVAWYLTDRQGSVRALTDNTGVVQDRLTYDGYGRVKSESNSSFGDRYKYTGREWDGYLNLQYSRARWYDPVAGRWTSEDPLGFAAGDSNLNRYGGNNPTNKSDPSGQSLVTAWEDFKDDLKKFGRDPVGNLKFAAEQTWNAANGLVDKLSGGLTKKLREGLGELAGTDFGVDTKSVGYRAGADAPQAAWNTLNGFLDTVTAGGTRFVREGLGSLLGTDFGVDRSSTAYLAGTVSGTVFSVLTGNVWGAAYGTASLAEAYANWSLKNPGAQFAVGKDQARWLRLGAHTVQAVAGARGLAGPTGWLAGAVPGGGLLLGLGGGYLAGKHVYDYASAIASGKPMDLIDHLEQTVPFLAGAAAGMTRGAQAEFEAGLMRGQQWQQGFQLWLAGERGCEGWFQACFEAGTLLEIKDGWKAIEEFLPGDKLLSRSEFDPDGPVEERAVEEVFVRLAAAVVELRLAGGGVIGTTAEHPFNKRGRGWVGCGELRAGDEVRTRDGWVVVEGVKDTGRVVPVFNLRVAEYHTYFVGGPDWGFGVWAHNICKAADVEREIHNIDSTISVDPAKALQIAKLMNQGKLSEALNLLQTINGIGPGRAKNTVLGLLPKAGNKLTQVEYDYLRSKTPDDAARAALNPPGTTLRDAAYGHPVGKLEPDHTVSMKQITEMPGFNLLPVKKQIEILNTRENFVGLERRTNGSKQDLTWAEWSGHPQLGSINPSRRAKFVRMETKLAPEIQAAILKELGLP